MYVILQENSTKISTEAERGGGIIFKLNEISSGPNFFGRNEISQEMKDRRGVPEWGSQSEARQRLGCAAPQ